MAMVGLDDSSLLLDLQPELVGVFCGLAAAWCCPTLVK